MTEALNRSQSFKPNTVRREDIPSLQGASDKSADRKLKEIQAGGDLVEVFPALPAERPWQNWIWIPFFLLVVVAMVVLCYVYAGDVISGTSSALPDNIGSDRQIWIVVGGGFLGALVSTVLAIVFLQVTHSQPAAVVYVSLYAGPIISIAAGIAIMASADGEIYLFVIGALTVLLGVLGLVMVCCCYKDLIPFMIEVMHMVSEVIIERPAMLIISFLLAFLNLVWTMVCGVGFGGAIYHNANAQDDDPSNNNIGLFVGVCCVTPLVFFWGAMVLYNVCYVTYCGVFARWYYQKPYSEGPVCQSLAIAVTKSFGSICFGSFLVAFVRMVEAMVSSARKAAKSDGNYVVCCLLCCIECFIACIGDMLEYFNEWAYVTCAIRGVGFMDSVRITFAVLTCGNTNYVMSDLLLNSVINMGSLLCAVAGGLFSYLFGLWMSDKATAGACALLGLIGATVAGGTAFGVVGSGVKTIMMCWVDNPEMLKSLNPAMDVQLTKRISDGYEKQHGLQGSGVSLG